LRAEPVWRQRLVVSLVLMAAAALGVYAVVGLHARYWQDDYCMGALLHDRGWLGAQQAIYHRWTGKVSMVAAAVTALWVGPRAAPVLPVLALVAWLAALTWALAGLAHSLGRQVSWRSAAAMAVVGVFLATDRMPDYVHSLYYLQGMFAYTAPLVALTVLAGVGIRWPRSRHPALMLGVLLSLAFIVGGFSETAVAVETGALAILLAWLVVLASPSARSQWLPPLVAGLLGAVVALGAMAASPGNATRLAALPPRASWAAIAAATTQYTLRHLVWWLLLPPFTVMYAVAASIVVGRATLTHGPNTPRWTAAGIALGALGLAWASILPAVWGYGPAAGPEGRTYTVTSFVLTCGLCAIAILLSRSRVVERLVRWWVASPRRLTVMVLLLALSPAASVARALTLLPQIRTYALAWDTRDQWIRSQVDAGVRRLTVVPLPTIAGLNDVADSPPRNWVNQCIADYYGLAIIEPTQENHK
jgi:hypothetical protein